MFSYTVYDHLTFHRPEYTRPRESIFQDKINVTSMYGKISEIMRLCHICDEHCCNIYLEGHMHWATSAR
jgi:hypothetical protein